VSDRDLLDAKELLSELDFYPDAPPSPSRSAESQYYSDVANWKQEALNSVGTWDKLALLSSVGFADFKDLRDNSTHYEIALMYMKKVVTA
jgi:hypothetical protein